MELLPINVYVTLSWVFLTHWYFNSTNVCANLTLKQPQNKCTGGVFYIADNVISHDKVTSKHFIWRGLKQPLKLNAAALDSKQ